LRRILHEKLFDLNKCWERKKNLKPEECRKGKPEDKKKSNFPTKVAFIKKEAKV
jgi:hypothetical protein